MKRLLNKLWWIPALAAVWWITRRTVAPLPTEAQQREFDILNAMRGYGDAAGAAQWRMRDDGIMLVWWDAAIGINPNAPVRFSRLIGRDGHQIDPLSLN